MWEKGYGCCQTAPLRSENHLLEKLRELVPIFFTFDIPSSFYGHYWSRSQASPGLSLGVWPGLSEATGARPGSGLESAPCSNQSYLTILTSSLGSAVEPTVASSQKPVKPVTTVRVVR